MDYSEFTEWIAYFKLENETPEERQAELMKDPRNALPTIAMLLKSG